MFSASPMYSRTKTGSADGYGSLSKIHISVVVLPVRVILTALFVF